MNRERLGSALLLVAGLGFLATAALHMTGLDSVTRLVADARDDLRALGPALWMSFSLDYLVLGLVLLATWRSKAPSRLVVAVVGIAPIGAALLQLKYLGFVPPTAILLILGVLTFSAAAVLDPRPASASRPAV